MTKKEMFIIIDGPKSKALILKNYFLRQGFEVYEEEQEHAPSGGIYNMPLSDIDPQILVAMIGAAGTVAAEVVKAIISRRKDTLKKGSGIEIKVDKSGDIEIDIKNAKKESGIGIKVKEDDNINVQIDIKNATAEDVRGWVKKLNDIVNAEKGKISGN